MADNDKPKIRPNITKEARKRSEMDAMSTVIKDKAGNIIFDGRSLEKKPKQ